MIVSSIAIIVNGGEDTVGKLLHTGFSVRVQGRLSCLRWALIGAYYLESQGIESPCSWNGVCGWRMICHILYHCTDLCGYLIIGWKRKNAPKKSIDIRGKLRTIGKYFNRTERLTRKLEVHPSFLRWSQCMSAVICLSHLL